MKKGLLNKSVIRKREEMLAKELEKLTFKLNLNGWPTSINIKEMGENGHFQAEREWVQEKRPKKCTTFHKYFRGGWINNGK